MMCEAFLCAQEPAGVDVLRGMFALAREDAAFAAEVEPAFGARQVRSAERLLALRRDSAAGRPADVLRAGLVPLDPAWQPVLAAVLWWRRSPAALGVPGNVCNRVLEGLLRAGRHCVERLVLDGASARVEDPARLPSLAHMELLREVSARFVPPRLPCAQTLVAALARHAPPALTSLDISWAPCCPEEEEEGEGERAARWTAALPGSLLRLSLEEAGDMLRAGLAAAVADSCPRLHSLSLGMDGSAWDEPSAGRHAATLLPLLGAETGCRHVHTLALSDVCLSPRLAASLGAAAAAAGGALRHLTLNGVYTLAADERATPGSMRSLGRGLRALQSLALRDCLHRDEAELGPLLEGMAAAGCGALASLELTLPEGAGALPRACRALAALLSTAPVRDLCVSPPRSAEALTPALADALACAAPTLRTLRLHELTVRSHGTLHHLAARLAECTALRHLSLQLRGQSWQEGASADGTLAHLLQALAPGALDLELLDSGCITHPRRLSLEQAVLRGEAQNFPESAAAYAALRTRRDAEARSRPAWLVVCAGLLDQQERRVAAGAGRWARTPAASSPLAALPASVLRDVATFLPHKAAPLTVY